MSREQNRARDHADPEVAIICALQIESDAVETLFDKEEARDEEEVVNPRVGGGNYTFGRICQHPAVLAYLPGIGKATSSTVAADIRSRFPSIRLGLLVGICGGVPIHVDTGAQILLGDVIISTGLVQFDLGRQSPNQFQRKDALQDEYGRPNAHLRVFLRRIQGRLTRSKLRAAIPEYIAKICSEDDCEQWGYPGSEHDLLYETTYRHKHQTPGVCAICDRCTTDTDPVCDVAVRADCTQLLCDESHSVSRGRTGGQIGKASSADESPPEVRKPAIHFGLVASGDTVMASGAHRNSIASKEKVICFEMEGAGVWDHFPTVIIKGVCDYADSHKGKRWQQYAAVSAAACAKAFLAEWQSGHLGEGDGTTPQGSRAPRDDRHVGFWQGGSVFGRTTTVSGGKSIQGNINFTGRIM
jgi:nucleoside phosphorylase